MFFVGAQEIPPRDSGLSANGSKSRTLDSAVIRHCQRGLRAVGVVAYHGDVLPLPHRSETESLKGLDDALLRRLGGELGHQIAISVSATKASKIGDSAPNTSLPKVST
jgi:hypothetical protein